MLEFNPDTLARWLQTSWKHGPPSAVTGVSIDSRTLRAGELYVALRGDRFDGHDFVEQAFEKGASGALVEKGSDGIEAPLLCVEDSLAGLQTLAREYRSEWTARVVGITGSVGKTTVKEMCAEVLSISGKTHRTAGNFNNHIGLPLSMLRMPSDAAFGVFEIGMNRPGEMEELCGLLRPDIGILTEIGDAHRENFSSTEEIAQEKAQLIAVLPENGLAILDEESPWIEQQKASTKARVVTVSMEQVADYAGSMEDEQALRINHALYSIPLPGVHMMKNALLAVALGLECGMTPEAVRCGLGNVKMPAMRWEEHEVQGILFINDAYNANPLSMRAALSTFNAIPIKGKRWAVLGAMHELGAIAQEEHAALGDFIDELSIDGVITIGDEAASIICRTPVDCVNVKDTAAAADLLQAQLKPMDGVLLKASRSEHLEQVLEIFKEKRTNALLSD